MESWGVNFTLMLVLGGLFAVACSTITTSAARILAKGGLELPVYHIAHPKYGKYNDSHLDDSTVVAYLNNPVKYSYLAEFEIGTPPVKVSAVVDTGSSFTWLSAQAFDYFSSKSYAYLDCNDPRCSYAVGTDCSTDESDRCTYYARYAGNRVSSGYAGQDVLQLSDDIESVDKKTSVWMVVGNQDPHDKTGEDDIPGVLGLGYDVGGLLGRLFINTLSICLPLAYPDSSYIRFGDKAQLLGNYTQLKLKADHYYFTVKSISVADEIIQIPNEEFNIYGTGGFIFDTGASVTNLHPAIMDEVRDAMLRAIGIDGTSDARGSFDFCYEDWQLENIRGYTKRFQLQLYFSDGNSLRLGFSRTWTRVGNLWCLAFLRSGTNRTIFGSWQMRGINFGLDPKAGRLYYQPDTNC